MRIKVNGKQLDTMAATLSDLVNELGVQDNFIVVAKNDQMVLKSEWGKASISVGDNIEIITPVGGG